MRVGIVARPGRDRAVRLAGAVAAGITGEDVDVVVDETTHEALETVSAAAGDDLAAAAAEDSAPAPPDEAPATVPPGVPAGTLAACDLAVSIGGDGTFLYTARNAGTTPLLGINCGEVGFLTAVDPDAAVETARTVVEEIREDGSPRTATVPRLVAEGADWTLGPAVNEVVLQGSRRGHGGGLDVSIHVDGAQYWAGHADGVFVATPFGSTAYNVSEGGPLVQPGVDAMVVTTMAGAGAMPPLVVDGDATVRLSATGPATGAVIPDGLDRRTVDLPATVEVDLTADPLAIAEPSIDFFAALSKLD